MTLMLKLDADIMKMYLLTKMKFVAEDIQKLEPERDTHKCFFAPVTLAFPDDLDIRSWPSYSEDVTAYKKWSF